MNIVEQAIDLANKAHGGQKRKYGGLPYIMHPAQVAGWVANLPGVTEEEIAAAWLHDVLEDCSSYEDEVNKQPAEVVRLVREMTNPSKGSSLPRDERKRLDREHLKGISWKARRIKLIDRILNVRDITRKADAGFAQMYCEESALLLQALQGTDAELEASLLAEINRGRLGLSKR